MHESTRISLAYERRESYSGPSFRALTLPRFPSSPLRIPLIKEREISDVEFSEKVAMINCVNIFQPAKYGRVFRSPSPRWPEGRGAIVAVAVFRR